MLKRIYAGFIPLPWILAATLFLNGKLDSPKNVVYYPTTVQSRFNMRGIVPGAEGFSYVLGVPDKKSSGWRWTLTITIVSMMVTPWWWA